MGLLKAGAGALAGVLGDAWRDYFYCDSLDADTLVIKGKKRVDARRSSNTKGSENIITNGSIIAVNEGQCMLVVEQGKVVEICDEPGEFLFDSGTEPSIMYGGFNKENVKKSFQTLGKRFTFGGDTAKDQRVFFVNTKEIYGNKYGTASPIPFRVVDPTANISMEVSLRCNGEFSYVITDPIVFYTTISSNVAESFQRSSIESQLRSELLTYLQPAFSKLSAQGISYSELPAHTLEVRDELDMALTDLWGNKRGIKVASFGISSVNISDEDFETIKKLQRRASLKDSGMAGATLVEAQAEAMLAAAGNEGAGPFMAFAGMNMANMMGGANPQSFYNAAAAQAQQPSQAAAQQPAQAAEGWKCECGAVNSGKFCSQCGKPQPTVSGWKCECGAVNSGKFCPQCGKPQPIDNGWSCECGAVNQGKFCPQCGRKKPAEAPLYRCDKCGWTPEDPYNPPRFCPECGDAFDENDAK